MNARLKIFAAALGLLVAVGTVADASADTIRKTVVTKTVTTGHFHRHIGTRFFGPRIVRRPVFGPRLVETVRVVHRGPTFVRIVHPERVRVVHRGFIRHAMLRRPAVVIR